MSLIAKLIVFYIAYSLIKMIIRGIFAQKKLNEMAKSQSQHTSRNDYSKETFDAEYTVLDKN